MNRYTRQFFSLLNTICKKIRQQIFNQKPSQPASQPKKSFSFLEATRRAEEQSASEQSEAKLIAHSTREESQHRNSGKKSKRAKWAEKRSKQKIAYAEAQANGDLESIRKYWKWIKRYGASTTEYYAREKARRKAAKNNQNLSNEAKKRQAEIKADAQCEFPEDAMIEHLEDHRDGIGWSIAALAKKRFYVRRTLKINDSNGDMFCEVDDNGESLLKAVNQLISEHNHSNENK